MDLGCYTMSMARLIAGAALGREVAEPLDVKGCAWIGAESRVDQVATAALRFPRRHRCQPHLRQPVRLGPRRPRVGQ